MLLYSIYYITYYTLYIFQPVIIAKNSSKEVGSRQLVEECADPEEPVSMIREETIPENYRKYIKPSKKRRIEERSINEVLLQSNYSFNEFCILVLLFLAPCIGFY